MMKRTIYTIFTAALLAVATLTASAQGGENRQVSGYNAIAAGGSFDVQVKIDGTESLKINASSEALEHIETFVKNDCLNIRWKRGEGYHNYGKVEVYVTAKALSKLINSGSGSMKVDGTVDGSNVSVVLSGSGNISSAVNGGTLSATISGSGSISLNGTTNETKLSIAGSGGFDSKGLKTQDASVSITGSGNARFTAEKTVSANIVGSGDVTYSGNATTESVHTIGSGRVHKE